MRSIHWSRRAYQEIGDPHTWLDHDEDDPDAEEPVSSSSIALYPIIKLPMGDSWRLRSILAPKQSILDAILPEFLNVQGPVSDNVVPIILGYDHRGVYVREDVGDYLKGHLAPTQRYIPVRCDGETIPYLALIDLAPAVWLPENWVYQPCSERSAPELDDSKTITSPIFPDRFSPDYGVHLVGNKLGLFLDAPVWRGMAQIAPNLSEWLDAWWIVVE